MDRHGAVSDLSLLREREISMSRLPGINAPERSASVAGEDGLIHIVTFYSGLSYASEEIDKLVTFFRRGGVRDYSYTSCTNMARVRPMILRDREASRDLRRVNCLACLSAKENP